MEEPLRTDGPYVASAIGVPESRGRFCRLGWAFTLAWAFCVWYTKGIDGYTGLVFHGSAQSSWLLGLVYNGLPALTSIGALFALVALEHRIGALREIRGLLVSAPVTCALSTPLMFAPFDNPPLAMGAFIVGSLIGGFGSSALWLMWGTYYGRQSQETIEKLVPAAAVVAALLLLVVSAMRGWVAIVIVSSLPLCSGACFAASWQNGHHDAAPDDGRQPSVANNNLWGALKGVGRISVGLLTICAFWTLGMSMRENDHVSLFTFQLAIMVAVAFTAAVAFVSTAGPRRISVPFLYRWMCPALVGAYILTALGHTALSEGVVLALLISTRFAFCLVIMIFFAQFTARTTYTPIQTFGLGKLFVNAGDLIGAILTILVDQSLHSQAQSLESVALVCVGVFFVVTVFVLGERRHPTHTVDPAPFEAQGSNAGITAPANSSNGELDQAILAVAVAHALTPRETEVLGLLARGRSVPYIRDALCISRQTAATHAKRIYAKLGVHSKQELIDLVVR